MFEKRLVPPPLHVATIGAGDPDSEDPSAVPESLEEPPFEASPAGLPSELLESLDELSFEVLESVGTSYLIRPSRSPASCVRDARVNMRRELRVRGTRIGRQATIDGVRAVAAASATPKDEGHQGCCAKNAKLPDREIFPSRHNTAVRR